MSNKRLKRWRKSEYIRSQLKTDDEKTIFNRMTRELCQKFPNIANNNYILIEMIAVEYIRYARSIKNEKNRIARGCVSAMIDLMSELNVTPKSRGVGEVGTTLSELFKVLRKDNNASN